MTPANEPLNTHIGLEYDGLAARAVWPSLSAIQMWIRNT
jgi:hypothetical protein